VVLIRVRARVSVLIWKFQTIHTDACFQSTPQLHIRSTLGKKEGGASIKPEKVEKFQSCGQSNEVKIQLHEAFI
jgi:hypothetical protein